MDNEKSKNEENYRLKPIVRIILFAIAAILALFAVEADGFLNIILLIFGSSVMLVSALTAKNTFETVSSLMPGVAAYIIGFLTSMIYSGDVEYALIRALPAVFAILPSLGIWTAMKFNKSRSVSIAFSAFLCVIAVIFSSAVKIKIYIGALDISTVRAVLDEYFGSIGEMLSNFTYDNGTADIQLYNDADIANIVNTAKRTMIGTLGASMLVLSYFVTAAARFIAVVLGVYKIFPTDERDEVTLMPTKDGVGVYFEHIRSPWRIELSTVSAGVAVAAYFVKMLFSSDDQLTAVTAAENLMILLLPGLVYVGLRAFMMLITGNSRGIFGIRSPGKSTVKAIIFTVIGIAMLIVSPAALLLCLALNGIIDIFSENLRRKSALRVGENNKSDRKE